MPTRRDLLRLLLAAAGSEACERKTTQVELKVAAAANVAEVLARIAALFGKNSQARVAITPGASGKLYAQIENGAPFHLFLSADAERPARLEAKGLAVPGSRFTYALGRLAVVGRLLENPAQGADALRAKRYQRLAIANPETAPYGAAALQVLAKLGVSGLEGRIVRGENVAQALQFVDSGAAELGLVALSSISARRALPFWKVPHELHAPIRQDAVLLAIAKDMPEAAGFMAFLRGDQARAELAAAGYDVPSHA
jgi:molybdate transport system substrate-binding protein